MGPTPDCGDSYLTEDETCDDGNDVTELCDYGATECMVCDSACQYVSGPTRYCGDGVLNAEEGEECDNANLNADDAGCLEACISATCGDGLLRMDLPEGIEGYEACDDGEGNNDLGACLSDCVVASCGDGFRRQDIAQGEVGYEACDDGAEDSEICDAFDCSFAACGDGYVNAVAGETCDDGNRITERCLEMTPTVRCAVETARWFPDPFAATALSMKPLGRRVMTAMMTTRMDVSVIARSRAVVMDLSTPASRLAMMPMMLTAMPVAITVKRVAVETGCSGRILRLAMMVTKYAMMEISITRIHVSRRVPSLPVEMDSSEPT